MIRLDDIRPSVGGALIFFITFALYSVTLGHGFVSDDTLQILENRWIKDTSYIFEILRSSGTGFSGEVSNSYRPMLHLVFMLDYHLFGLNPWGYHLVNITLFSLNGLLFFFLSRLIFKRYLKRIGDGDETVNVLAFISALIFTLHPINTEVGNWVSAVPELVFTLFFLLAIYTYMASRGRFIRFFIAPALFFLSLVGKETAVALIPLLPFLEYLTYGTFLRRWRGYIPFFVALSIYLAIRGIAVGGMIDHKIVDLTAFEIVINIFPLLASYLGKLFLPTGLSAMYSIEHHTTLLSLTVVVSISLTLLIALLLYLYRRDGTILFASALIILPLLPAMYLPAIIEGGFAERYLYLPSGGFAIILTAFTYRLYRYFESAALRVPVILAVLLLLLTYSLATYNRSLVWKDDISLWGDASRKLPEYPVARFFYGLVLHNGGRLDDALREYGEAVRLDEDLVEAHHNMAIIYEGRGELEEAIDHLEEAVKGGGIGGTLHGRLGTLYYSVGDIDRALLHLEEAVRLDPGDESGHYNLAYIYDVSGRPLDAIAHYKEVLRLNREAIDARFNLALIYLSMGRVAGGRAELEEVLKVDPDHSGALGELKRLRRLGSR